MSADAPCPEPKPIAIFLLTAAGLLGGVLDGLISTDMLQQMFASGGITFDPGFWPFMGALIGGGIGVAVGVTVALSRRAWVRIALSLPLGLIGMTLSMSFPFVSSSQPEAQQLNPQGVLLLFSLYAAVLGAPSALCLVLAHNLFLKWRARPKTATRSLPLFMALGAASGLVFWIWFTVESQQPSAIPPPAGWERIGIGLADGALYGLLQWLAMMAALAVDRNLMRPRLEPWPSAPEPPA